MGIKFEYGKQTNLKFKRQSSRLKFYESRLKEICEGLRQRADNSKKL